MHTKSIGLEIDEHENQLRVVAHHSVQSVTVLFPSALCSAVIEIISLLNDPAVTDDGNSVCEVAYQVHIHFNIYNLCNMLTLCIMV